MSSQKFICTLRLSRTVGLQTFRRYSQHVPITREFEEIQIPVSWGYITGKWYGPKDVRPILGLHGWQDNAGTFDPLAQHLPQHVPFLALDLPGHGISSRIPNGLFYHSSDYVPLMFTIMDHFKWPKISVISHSMSAVNTFLFAGLFPDKIDMFIALDVLKPLMRGTNKFLELFSQRLIGNRIEDARNTTNREPPSYTFEECIERLYIGGNKSVEREFCKYLLERNLEKSSKDPQKFFFSRDGRLKTMMFATFEHETILEMARRITAPHLFIKAKSAPYFENKKYYDDALKLLQTKPGFEYHEVEGTHHVHLNEAKKISEIINPFIITHRPKYSE